MKFFIVDAFTTTLFGGNTAGIILLNPSTDFPSKELMIQTAAELKYSETAFIKQLDLNTFNIRYFTPADEVDLCGHATIAAFHTLLKENIITDGNSYINKTLAGDLNILVESDSILMDMADPKIFEYEFTPDELNELYSVMRLDFNQQNLNIYPQKVSTGLIDIIMPVKDELELEKINPDFEKLKELSKHYDVVGVHAFTLNSKDGFLHTRNFAPLYDIDEESATGTSNGALSYYLYDKNLLTVNSINTIIQGEKMNRPSKILTKILIENNKPIIKVGGSAKILAKGEIYI